MPTKEFKKYNQTIEKLKKDGWCVFKKMTIIEDDDYPDKWHVLSVWRDSDYVSLTLVFDWQRGDGYYFMTNMYGKLRGTVLPKRLKFYEVYNVKSYLRGCFPYLNTAKKFAERLEEKVVFTKSDKILEHVENDDFFHVVDAFLGGFESLRNHTSLDWCIFVDAETGHQHLNTVALVNTHQIVFTGNEELSGAWIALTATTTTELVVDTA